MSDPVTSNQHFGNHLPDIVNPPFYEGPQSAEISATNIRIPHVYGQFEEAPTVKEGGNHVRSLKRDYSQVNKRRKYDPWKDIYQSGNFESEENSNRIKIDRSDRPQPPQNPREDSDYYYYGPADGVDDDYDYYDDGEGGTSPVEYQNEAYNDYDESNPVPDLISERRRYQPNRRRKPYDYHTGYTEGHPQQPHQQLEQTPTLTRRVANMVFSPVGYGIAAVVGIPLLLAGLYWLFVVNGPTPVVRARYADDDSLALKLLDTEPAFMKGKQD